MKECVNCGNLLKDNEGIIIASIYDYNGEKNLKDVLFCNKCWENKKEQALNNLANTTLNKGE